MRLSALQRPFQGIRGNVPEFGQYGIEIAEIAVVGHDQHHGKIDRRPQQPDAQQTPPVTGEERQRRGAFANFPAKKIAGKDEEIGYRNPRAQRNDVFDDSSSTAVEDFMRKRVGMDDDDGENRRDAEQIDAGDPPRAAVPGNRAGTVFRLRPFDRWA